MKIKKDNLFIGILVLLHLIFLTACSAPSPNQQQIPEHLRNPLPNYPRTEFVNYERVGTLGGVHEHADVAIYIEGRQVDLSSLRYQLTDKFVHLEEGRGDVVHKHATGVTIGYFLSTLGFKSDNNCITIEIQRLCDSGTKKLRVYVNGLSVENYKNYEFSDLDKVLVTYGEGNQDEIDRQLASITNNARIFSKK